MSRIAGGEQGHGVINVLSTHAGHDTAGIGYGLARAFARHPDIELRSAVRQSNYIDYPHDLDWSQSWKRAQLADVLHLHNTLRTAHVLHAWNKPAVLHHHGTHYRDNHVQLNREVSKKGARAVVSTLDMLEYSHDLTWVPHPYELDLLPPPAPVEGHQILIGHAPTDRAIKSTDAFLAACELFPDVVPVLIERATWSTCLKAKAAVDVYFDQVGLGYGCNAIEAWGMGIPVIAGAAPGTLERMRDTFGVLPFVEATETTIADAIAELISDDEVYATAQCLGQQHVRRWHDGRETRARLEPIYRELADRS